MRRVIFFVRVLLFVISSAAAEAETQPSAKILIRETTEKIVFITIDIMGAADFAKARKRKI